MSLKPQYLKPRTFGRFLVSREQKKKARKRMLIIGLTLTSMVDMFSLLVIFLLQTFSASPELMVVKGVTLPTASTGAEMKDAPLLAITQEGLFLDNKLIGKPETLVNDPEPLMSELERLRKLWVSTHPTETFKGEINLQVDKDIPSTTVSVVMGMLPSQSYGVFQLAVLSGGAAGGNP